MKILSSNEALAYLNQQIKPPIRKALALIDCEVGETNIAEEFRVSTKDKSLTYTAWRWDIDGLPLIKYGQGHWLFDDGQIRLCSIEEVNKTLYAKAPDLHPILSQEETTALRNFLDNRP